MKFVQACLSVRKELEKQFSPLWSSCEARTSLLMCRKDLIKPF